MAPQKTQKTKALSSAKENAPPSRTSTLTKKTTGKASKTDKAKLAAKVFSKNNGRLNRSEVDKRDAEIARLQAENANLRHVTTNIGPKICRPSGCSRSFKLDHAMGLVQDHELYAAIRRTIRRLVDRAGLDSETHWYRQPKDKIVKICNLATSAHSCLKWFPHNWATEEVIKQLLRSRRDYARKLAKQAGQTGGEEDHGNNGDEDESESEESKEDESESEDESGGEGGTREGEMDEGMEKGTDKVNENDNSSDEEF
ncbi:hypothetical protein JOM56_012757 [Amanita muscaria]